MGRGVLSDPAVIEEIIQMTYAGLDPVAIHNELGVPIPTIYRVRNEMTVRHNDGRPLEAQTQSDIIAKYEEIGDVGTIAEQFEVPIAGVYILLRQAGIDARNHVRGITRKSALDTACDMYKDGWNIFDILVETGLSSTTLYKELRRRKIPYRRRTAQNEAAVVAAGA